MNRRPAARTLAWRLAALALVALVALTLAGCKQSPPNVLGTWHNADTAGKPASLSDLTLTPDGRFRYGGKNALGGNVAFGGNYQTAVVNGSAVMRLIYDDFPNQPTIWFYRVDGNQLTVSSVQGNLTNGSALVFTRR
jgi:hypothetical protein